MQLGLLLGMIVDHALLPYRVYHLQGRGAPGGPGTTDGAPLVDADRGVVRCPDCEAENELGYRHGRSCVSELPAHVGFDRKPDSPRGRLTR